MRQDCVNCMQAFSFKLIPCVAATRACQHTQASACWLLKYGRRSLSECRQVRAVSKPKMQPSFATAKPVSCRKAHTVPFRLQALSMVLLRRPEHLHIDPTIPYELLVLEAALDACCRSLELEAGQLESQTVPVLNR